MKIVGVQVPPPAPIRSPSAGLRVGPAQIIRNKAKTLRRLVRRWKSRKPSRRALSANSRWCFRRPTSRPASRASSSEVQAKARINGFRPGKVPVAHLKRLYGRSIMAEVVQEAVSEAQRRIVEENKLRPAAQPKIDFPGEKEELEQAFEAKADFEFTVALEVCRRSRSAASRISKSNGSSPRSRQRDRRRPEAGSPIRTAPIRRKKTGRRRAGRQGDDRFRRQNRRRAFRGRIGRGRRPCARQRAASFRASRSNLKGLRLGESRTISVSFPQDYSAAHLAGKAATFDVTLRGLGRALRRRHRR